MTRRTEMAPDLPDSPPIGERERKRILEEARLWRESVRESFDAMEDITPEDWRTVVR